MIKIFKKYCRPVSDKPEMWNNLKNELQAAIITDYARIMVLSADEKKAMEIELNKGRILNTDEQEKYCQWYRNQMKTEQVIINENLIRLWKSTIF